MNRRFFSCVVMSVALLAPVFVNAENTFVRDLSLGSTGDDVFVLQKILNMRPETQISSEGVGSPGQESTYFGLKTKAAVIKYQELFAQDLLVPLGLASGTGFVGARTRAKLSQETAVSVENAPNVVYTSPSDSSKPSFSDALKAFDATLQGQKTIQNGQNAAFSTSSGGVIGNGPMVFPPNPENLAHGITITSISPTKGPSGTKVVLTGTGFTDSNTIYGAGPDPLVGFPSSDNGTKITITVLSPFSGIPKIPAFLRILVPDFSYAIYVTNQNGNSNPVPFVVTF